MYTSIFIESRTIVLQPTDLRRAREYLSDLEVRVIIQSEDMEFIDWNDPKLFNITAATDQEDHELRSFYELLVVQPSFDSRECTAVGSKMYKFIELVNNKKEKASTSNNSQFYVSQGSNHQKMFLHGICFLNGFKKNARVVHKDEKSAVKLVVDSVVSAFYADQRLADSFHDVTRGDYIEIKVLMNRVCLSVLKSRILTVRGLSREKLENIFFDKDGVQTQVIDHFAQVYGFHSEAGQMPALEVKFANGKYGYYPLDILLILKCLKLPVCTTWT
uniref:PAZ domain-containing protein n=1 Tax=Panagrolaimus sp. PS1159 TaxID=55785 RepID=A0AC35EUL5_9BILA